MWNSVYPEAEARVLNPFNGIALQLRSNVRRYGSNGLIEEVRMVTFLNIATYSNELGELNMKDAQKRPVKYKVNSLRQVVDGRETLHVGPLEQHLQSQRRGHLCQNASEHWGRDKQPSLRTHALSG